MTLCHARWLMWAVVAPQPCVTCLCVLQLAFLQVPASSDGHFVFHCLHVASICAQPHLFLAFFFVCLFYNHFFASSNGPLE